MKSCREKSQRTSDDIIVILTDEEELFRKKFITEKFDSKEWKCTICAKITEDTPYPHPALKVSVCFDCLNLYQDAIFLTNKDGTDKNCRWCSKIAKKYNCSSCTVVFCKDCMERNFDSDFVRNRVVNFSDWICFICDPKPIWRLRVACTKAMEKNKSTLTNVDETEIINLCSQEDRLPDSQQALPYSETHNDQFSSEIESQVISPKKVPRPIVESDDDNDLNTDEMSAEEKASLSVVLKETEQDLISFNNIFSTRVKQFSEKFQSNINTYAHVKKLVSKITKFYDNAIKNCEFLKHENKVRFEVWNNCAVGQSLLPEQSDKVCDIEAPPKSKSLPKTKPEKNNNNDEAISKTEVLNQPSISKARAKNTAKRKYSLSLKSPTVQAKNAVEDTLEYIERIKHKLPDDAITPPKKYADLPASQVSPSSPKITLGDDKISSKNHSNNEEVTAAESQENSNQSTEERRESNKCPITNLISSGSDILIKMENCSQISPIRSLEIKEEPDTFDRSSNFSNETVLRDNSSLPEQASIKQEDIDFDKQTACGEEELLARIQDDFGEEANVTVSIENYLCEKTGEFCQSYKTGQDSIEDEDSVQEFIFGSNDSLDSGWNFDKVDKQILEHNISIKEENAEKENTETQVTNEHARSTENYAETSDDKNSESDKQNTDINYSDAETIISDSENDGEATKTPNKSETSEDENSEPEKQNSDISNSDAESVLSDSEYDREAAFRALESDYSSDIDSDEFDSDCEGHVSQLDLAAEVAKLHRYNLEMPEDETNEVVRIESATEEEGEYIFDPKLKMEPVVVLNRDIKLSLRPVVKLDVLEFENGLKEVRNNISNSQSTNSDSESEINRLIDLTSLNKRKVISSSNDSDSDICDSRLKQKRKNFKKSFISSTSSDSSDSDESFKSIKSEPSSNDLSLNLAQKDKDFMPDIHEDLLYDFTSDGTMSEDDDVIEIREEKKKSDKGSVENLVTDEDEPRTKEVDGKSQWRKDKLLTGSLAIPLSNNSDTDATNDSTANEILKKQEDKYLLNIDKDKPIRKRSSSSDMDDDTIILSDDDDNISSDDSDIQFVNLKRKHESDEEGTPTKTKKGRRNIREVLKDNELQEETKKADKLEAERKERLSLKQKTLETILSESQLSEEEVGFVLDADVFKKEPLITVHHTLIPRLKEHQKKGIKFMWDSCYESIAELKRSEGSGCILAHCMGLGKTMQVVVLAHTLLTHEETGVKHILIVCPLSTVFNWRNEFVQTLKVCPKKIPIFDIRPDRQKRFNEKMFEVKRWRTDGGVLMLGYESFQTLVSEENLKKTDESYKQTMLESLIKPGPDLVVCDEGHMLKNGKTRRFTSLSKVKTSRRIILTGTPLQNNLIEYYHMVNFVKPHLLGTLDEYKNRFVNPILNGQYEDSNAEDIHLMKKRSHILHKKLETTVQRCEESELTQYLPEKIDSVLYTQLTPLQIMLYERYLQLLDINNKKLFKNYHALQNIWTHPALLKIKYDKKKEPAQKKQKHYDEYFVPALDPDSEDITTGLETEWFKDLLPEDILTNVSYGVKMEILFSIIKECETVKDKLLVFSSSMDELDLIESFLKQKKGEIWTKGTDYYRMDGTVAPEKRMKYCNDFNHIKNEKFRVFLVSHKVGGLGLNLTAANRVVLMDVSWNPAYDIQSVFRVYRFGQTKTCYVYRFVSMGTMEEVVYSRSVTKLAISCRVVDEHQIKRHFNSDDLQRMYRLIKDYGEPPTLALPSDRLLAKLWENHKPLLYKFCDHQSLLENLPHEELNEQEMKLAWEEFRSEVEREELNKETGNNNRYGSLIAQLHNYSSPQLPIYNAPQIPNYNVPQVPDKPNNRYPQPPKVPMVQPLDLQQNYQLPNNARYKPPNALPSKQDIINRAYFEAPRNYAPFFSANKPSRNNLPSTSTSVTSIASNRTTAADFSAPSTSKALNLTLPRVAQNLQRNNNLSSNIAKKFIDVYSRHVQDSLKNSGKPNIYLNPFSGNNGQTTIRNQGKNIYDDLLPTPDVPVGVTKFIPSVQKENIARSIQNLNNNGVTVSPRNKTSKFDGFGCKTT